MLLHILSTCFFNKAGGIFVVGSLWLKGSEIFDNFGIFGGIYMKDEFILSITFCKFDDSRGIAEGSCIHTVNCALSESEECTFNNCDSSTISFYSVPNSVRF
jgi:hypothetical protein